MQNDYAIKDIEYPTSPRIAIFLLPYLSLVLPQNALVVAHAKADIAKIEEVCISLKPKSLARGGTRTKTNDWPRPTVKRPNFNHEEPEIDIN